MWDEVPEKCLKHLESFLAIAKTIKSESQRWGYPLVAELSKGNLKTEMCFSMQPFNQMYFLPHFFPLPMLYGVLAFS